MEYKAFCGNTSRTLHGCNNPNEALEVAIKAFNDCMDHTEAVEIYSMGGEFLISEIDFEEREV